MNPPENQLPQITPDQVKDFLEGKDVPIADVPKTSTDLPPLGEIKVDLPPPSAPTAQVAEAEDTRLETEPNPLSDPAMPAMTQRIYWEARDSFAGDVKVSDDEKALYLKAALNDAILYWDVPLLHGRLKAKCRSLNHYEVDVIFRAIRLDEADGLIQFEEQRFSRIQWYTACMQVVAIQDKSMSPLTLEPSDPGQMDEDARKLRIHYDKTYRHLSSPRWAQMLTAMRVFAIKEKLCNDALANEDFWKPADGV